MRLEHYCTALSAWTDRHSRFLLASILTGCFAIRLLIYIAFEQVVISNSLFEGYLLPRLTTSPWKVDWSYGPLTYLIYWQLSYMPLSSLLNRALNALADSASAFIIAEVSRRFTTNSKALLSSASWAFAPTLIWSSTFGSTDALPILATLGAVYFLLKGRSNLALLLVGIGFALKWYPILLLPLIVRSLLPKHGTRRLIIISVCIFVFDGLLVIVSSAVSGLRPSGELALTIQYFSSRFPVGTSVWNLLVALIPSSSFSTSILSLASYFSITAIVLLVGLRSRVEPQLQFIRSSAIMLFAVVNIASQILPHYLLWFYPLMLIIVICEPMPSLIVRNLSLLFAGFLFAFLFTLPRQTSSILNPVPQAFVALPIPYDVLTIAAFQACAWILLKKIIK